MSGKTSFEQLCAGRRGYASEQSAMAKLNREESFNDLIFKLVTKCETDLIFLPSPTSSVSQFTLDVVPNHNNSAVSEAWQTCEEKAYDGLHVIASLDASNVLNSNSLGKYAFIQFVDSVIRGMEAYFMFQRYNTSFALNALSLWSCPTEANMQSCYIVLAWKFDRQPDIDMLSRVPLSQLNLSSKSFEKAVEAAEVEESEGARRKSLPAKRSKPTPASVSKPTPASARGRRSLAPVNKTRRTDESTDEDDPEISFKKKPEIMPKVLYLPEQQASPAKKPQPMNVEPIAMEDITFGFEKGEPKKAGRKSTGRKSLMPDWPEEEKHDLLYFFDNLNPSQNETTRVALTCKYASMQYDRELPSKLLYQWVQKKGRPVLKTSSNFTIPEKEQREVALELFKKLNEEVSEISRLAFTCKFLHAQFGISITSKDFYNWLDGQGKKTTKRR